jgi:DNA-binding MarR family transcriptional regulator
MMKQTRQEADDNCAVAVFEQFMTLFSSAQQILRNRMQDEAEQGLGPLHLRALCLCLRTPGTTQQQLVQSMGRDKGQIARLTRELEERDFLVRTQDECDRRVWRLAVTPAGEQKSHWFSAIEAGLANDLFGDLFGNRAGVECAQMEPLLTQLRERVDALSKLEK